MMAGAKTSDTQKKDQKPADDRNSAIGFTRDDASPELAPDVNTVEETDGLGVDGANARTARQEHGFVATDMRVKRNPTPKEEPLEGPRRDALERAERNSRRG